MKPSAPPSTSLAASAVASSAASASSSSGSPPAPTQRDTARRFSVSVPVLSVQMTCTAPSASTALRLFTSTFRRAMRSEPMASDSVKVGSSPSGTLATMMPIMNTRLTHSGRPEYTP